MSYRRWRWGRGWIYRVASPFIISCEAKAGAAGSPGG